MTNIGNEPYSTVITILNAIHGPCNFDTLIYLHDRHLLFYSCYHKKHPNDNLVIE